MTEDTTILTNGERTGEVGPLRQFQLLAEHEGKAWVKALNGNYAGEMLTFDRANLKDLPHGR